MIRLPYLLAAAAAAAVVAFVLLVGGQDRAPMGPGSARSGDGPPPLPPPPLVEEGPEPPLPVPPEPRPGPRGTAPGPGPGPEPDPAPLLDLEAIRALIDAKQAHDALEALDRVIEKDPENGAAFALRGELHMMMGWNRRAEQDLADAARLNGDSPALLLARAETMIRLRRPREAEDFLRRSMTLEPDQARAHALLAVVRLQEQDEAGAEKEIREAVRIDPEEDLTKNLKGRLRD